MSTVCTDGASFSMALRVVHGQVRPAQQVGEVAARREAHAAELGDEDRVRPELPDAVAQRLSKPRISDVMPTIAVMPMTTPSTVSAERSLLRAQRVERQQHDFPKQGERGVDVHLFTPQCFDRIEPRGARGGIETEEQADGGGDADAERDRPRLEPRGQRRDRGDALRRRATPSAIPTRPPKVDSVTDSVSTCDMMSRRRAPSALRRPISRVRSLTTISMMFMMTMPPTTSESATTPTSTAKMPLVAW